jgi:L-ribulose-5-phosphate 3-epimerase UlaE
MKEEDKYIMPMSYYAEKMEQDRKRFRKGLRWGLAIAAVIWILMAYVCIKYI